MSSDIVNAAAIIELPNPSASMPIPLTNIVRPSKPKTTEGTPAKFEILILIIRVNVLSRAYSSKYIAVPTPRMIEMGMIVTINHSVPTRAPLIPAILGVEEENDVKKCKLR